MEYQHGGDVYSQDIQTDYSVNIDPLGMPGAARQALRGCLERRACNLYPDSRCKRLRRALGRYHGVEKQQIIYGNGAVDLIFGLTAALRPVRGLATAPVLPEYEQALRPVRCRTDYYYLRRDAGFALDAVGMYGCIREAAERGELYDVVSPCNSNNPIGIPMKREEVEQLANTCERLGAYLAVDECFCDFLDVWESYSVIPGLARFKHLFVLKALTRLYTMAGLRLGYGLCSDEGLLEQLQAVRQPWSMSGPTQCADVAALGETDLVEHIKEVIKGERERLSGAPHDLGFRVYPLRVSYLFFRDRKEDGTLEKGRLYQELPRRRILIHSCTNYPGLDSPFYRICVKLRQDNEQLIREMARMFERRKPCLNIQSQL